MEKSALSRAMLQIVMLDLISFLIQSSRWSLMCIWRHLCGHITLNQRRRSYSEIVPTSYACWDSITGLLATSQNYHISMITEQHSFIYSLKHTVIICSPCKQKNVREKSREWHNHKPQPFPDTKRKRKPTNPNKHKSNKRTKSTKITLFRKRGNRNAKRTGKHKNKH